MASMYIMFAIILAVGGGFAIGITYYLDHKRKDNKVRILLFEQIGADKIFKGQTVGFVKNDKKLGVYIHLHKQKIGISDVSNDDLIFDPKFGKCLLVVKYADDDFRPFKRLKEGEWFKEVQVPVLEAVENTNAETGEKFIEQVPKLDKDNNPIFETKFIEYEESLGIDQDSREAMRFNRAFNERMNELMQEKKGWLEKYGSFIAISFVAITLMFSFIYMTKTQSQTMITISEDWQQEAEQYNSDNFFSRLTTWADTTKAEENQPIG